MSHPPHKTPDDTQAPSTVPDAAVCTMNAKPPLRDGDLAEGVLRAQKLSRTTDPIHSLSSASSLSSSSSSESVSSSETEKVLAEFASRFTPQQKLSFLRDTQRLRHPTTKRKVAGSATPVASGARVVGAGGEDDDDDDDDTVVPDNQERRELKAGETTRDVATTATPALPTSSSAPQLKQQRSSTPAVAASSGGPAKPSLLSGTPAPTPPSSSSYHSQQGGGVPTAAAAPIASSQKHEKKRGTYHRGGGRGGGGSLAFQRRRCLLRVMRQYATVGADGSGGTGGGAKTGTQPPPPLASSSAAAFPGKRPLGALWAEILPYCVNGYLELQSIVVLRRACRLLYFGRRYAVPCLTFEVWCTLTEQELMTKVLPQLRKFLTAGSFSQLNFSRCCLLTDTFPKALMQFQEGRLSRSLRALIFDYCYALSDKSLETLLTTRLPHLEILSLRCARSRDLTGAPFSSHLSKERWPRFHQLSCSCTQITLPHLDTVARFLAERAVELSLPPKLGISGSLASNSLIRRLGLEAEHNTFVNAIVAKGTVEAVEDAVANFEAKWLKKMDDPEHKAKVLHRLVRNRGTTILVNAPCSVAVVDDGAGHEKAKWLLLDRRKSGAFSQSRPNTKEFGLSPGKPASTTTTTGGGGGLPATLFSAGGTTSKDPTVGSGSAASAAGGGTDPASVMTPLRPSSGSLPNPKDTTGMTTTTTTTSGATAATTIPLTVAATPMLPALTELHSSQLPDRSVADESGVPTSIAGGVSSDVRPPLASPRPSHQKTSSSKPSLEGRSNSSPVGKSVIEDDNVLESLQATYSRWMYPLPIAIRLTNLAVVRLLINLGAYIDVWGYNFATPLYIACATCPGDWDPPDASVAQLEASSSLHPLAPPSLPNEPVLPFALQKLGSIDSSSGVSGIGLSTLATTGTRGGTLPLAPVRAIDEMSTVHAEGSDLESPVSAGGDGLSTLGHHYDGCTAAATGYPSATLFGGAPEGGQNEKRTSVVRDSPDVTPHAAAWPTTIPWGDLSRELTFGSLGDPAFDFVEGGLSRMGSGVVCACPCHQREHADQQLASPPTGANASAAIVDLLLKAGAPVDAPDLYSVKCPVNAAIKNNNVNLLEKLIAAGAKINVRALPPNVIPPVIQLSRRQQQKKQPQRGLTRLGYKSPLFMACELNTWRCVEALLRHGADPHWRDPFSNRNVTPALLAYRKNPDMLPLFLRNGTGATKETRWVLSEILAAAILQDDVSAIGFLVKHYPDLLERESSGMWSLPLIQASRLGKVPVVQTLLSYGLTSLHLAANEGHKAVIECLLANGALPNTIGGAQKKSPLHIAVEENRKDVVETLLNYGADVTLKDGAGHTPLMSAIAARNDKVALLLLDHASAQELDIADSSQRTPLMYAIYFGQFKVADGLVKKGVTCRMMDATGATAESLLKEKIQSLGKSTSTINKFLRNIVGAGAATSQTTTATLGFRAVEAANPTAGGGPSMSDKGQGTSVSNESVRKLNAKRKKIAKVLLKKIRANAKKNAVVPQPAAGLSAHPSSPRTSSSITPQPFPPPPLSSSLSSGPSALVTPEAVSTGTVHTKDVLRAPSPRQDAKKRQQRDEPLVPTCADTKRRDDLPSSPPTTTLPRSVSPQRLVRIASQSGGDKSAPTMLPGDLPASPPGTQSELLVKEPYHHSVCGCRSQPGSDDWGVPYPGDDDYDDVSSVSSSLSSESSTESDHSKN